VRQEIMKNKFQAEIKELH